MLHVLEIGNGENLPELETAKKKTRNQAGNCFLLLGVAVPQEALEIRISPIHVSIMC